MAETQSSVVEITEDVLKLFHDYVGSYVTQDELLKKAHSIQEKALEVHDYKCIREGRFLVSRLAAHPYYKSLVLPELQQKKIIDIGCALGADIRKLIVDGAVVDHITAVDVVEQFWKLSMELFDDEVRKTDLFNHPHVFVLKSVLDDDFGTFMRSYLHKRYNDHTTELPFYDIVHLGSVLHLFTEPQTVQAVLNSLKLLKPGGVFIGQTVATTEDRPWNTTEQQQEQSLPPTQHALRFLHSPTSLSQLLHTAGLVEVDVSWRRKPEGQKMGLLAFKGIMPHTTKV